ncbi:MAG: hypothetical protein LBP89_06980 [Helicobacteraceae bacterium]|jgi:hypothetical protein|nr:hypothetical protein [Helicobacteraceae bacterium]
MFQSTDEAIASLPTNATAQEAKQTIDEAVIEAQRTLGYEPRAQIEYKPNFRLIGEQAPRALDTSEISRPLTNGATTPKTVSARTAGKEPAAIATQAPEITIEPLNVEAVKRLSQADGKIHIAEVTADEANEIAAAFKNQFGESVTFKPSQITRAIDGNQIRHTLNKHGDPKREAQFGGVAVTLDDIAKYPEIVKDHDFKIYSHTRRYNLPAIVYGKQINGYAIIVEEVRTGRGNIAFFDMYKHNGSLTEDMLRLMKDRTNSGKDRSPTLAPASNREGSAAPAQSETIPDRPPESQIPSWAKAKGFTALPDGRSVADRIVYYPNLSVSGLNRLLAKDKLSLADIERLRDYKWTLLFDKQAAIEKGFFVPYENGGYVPKNKFALTNIDEKLKAAGVDPAIEINNPLAKAEILRQRLIADGASEKIATEYAEALKLNEGRLNYALTSSYDDYLKNAKEQAALSNEIYKRLIDEGVTEQTAKLFANLDLDALKAWNRGKIDPVKRAKEIDAAKSQERAALGDGDYEAARDFLAANGVKDAKTPVGIPSTKRTVDGYSFYSALVDRQLANEIKRDPSFAYKRALDDAKMSEKFLSRRLANGEKELEGELNALRSDIANIEKKIEPSLRAAAEAKVANTERLIAEGDYETTRADLNNARRELEALTPEDKQALATRARMRNYIEQGYEPFMSRVIDERARQNDLAAGIYRDPDFYAVEKPQLRNAAGEAIDVTPAEFEAAAKINDAPRADLIKLKNKGGSSYERSSKAAIETNEATETTLDGFNLIAENDGAAWVKPPVLRRDVIAAQEKIAEKYGGLWDDANKEFAFQTQNMAKRLRRTANKKRLWLAVR